MIMELLCGKKSDINVYNNNVMALISRAVHNYCQWLIKAFGKTLKIYC